MQITSTGIFIFLLAGILAGCTLSDLPPGFLNAPKTKLHGVEVFSAAPPFGIYSISLLTGVHPDLLHHLNAKWIAAHTVSISHGTMDNWQWHLRADPVVVGAWTDWVNKVNVKRKSKRMSWRNLPVTWEQIMWRLHKVAHYLLGREPLPIDLKVLWWPDGYGVEYQTYAVNAHAVPLSFVFAFPVRSNKRHEARLRAASALIDAGSRLMWELQHVELAAAESKAQSESRTTATIRIVNNEATSACWDYASRIVLSAGTRSIFKIPLPRSQNLLAFQKRWGQHPTFQSAVFWARQIVTAKLAKFLESENLPNTFVVTNRRADNAVLGFCRELTRHAWNILKTPVSRFRAHHPPPFLR